MRPPSRMPTSEVPLARALDAAPRLVVRQARDWVELLDLERPSKYALLTEDGALAGMAVEDAGGVRALALRWFLRARRPFRLSFYGTEDRQRPVLKLHRPWTWWLSRVEVAGADGRPLGIVRERFSLLRRRLDVEAPDGRTLARIVGPVFRPWTFLMLAPGSDRELGRIEKRWSGVVSEMFTDADTFLVTLPASDEALRRLALAAAILVDFRFFEHRD